MEMYFFVAIQVTHDDELVETECKLGYPDDGDFPFRKYQSAAYAGKLHCENLRKGGSSAKNISYEVYVSSTLDPPEWTPYQPSDEELAAVESAWTKSENPVQIALHCD